MMIQPRAYMYRPSSPEKDGRRKSTIRSSSPKTAPSPLSARRPSSTPLPEPKQPEPVQAQPEPKPAFVGRTASEPVKIPISQMLVQPRYHPSARSRNTTDEAQSSKSRGLHGGWSNRKLNERHDPSALPPAVAALLAVTSIPPPSRINRRRTSQQRRISIDELIEEWRQEDKLSSSAEKYKSPLDILLEPADEAEDEDDGLLAGTEDEKDAPVLSSRSVSSDSISSTPSLAPSLDPTHSTVSSASTPRTPSYHRKVKPLSIRTDRIVSSPPAEQCLDSHPLQTPVVTESFIIPEKAFPPRQKPVVKQKSSFKSNLTASFSALKSAAKSFSNFTAPSIPQDDLLTRSFFSQPYPPEMRPRDIDGVPDPALRRYLNPQHNTLPPLSSDDFSLRFQEALAQPTTEPDDSPLVQMQTFSRRGKKSRVRSTSGVSVGPDRGEASVLGQSLPAIRQREPRENSDFLRVIVLEMNMRRTGKLDARAALRARIWLPPRKNGEGNGGGSEVEVRGGKEVPMRWVGLCLDDL